ncbi:hypothetical protein [Aneurinibacillus tyrosinisolvens]|uniref:hypothetical protein n=1 Tax=Aneurinibacillus tyrosinisolvens TaxID=1443435 RepID=UPI00063F5584|nr:hypothetical protein [Aneurinibacillus tyrosinisolvens]
MKENNKIDELLQAKKEAEKRNEQFTNYAKNVQEHTESSGTDEIETNSRLADQQNRLKDKENLRK